MKLHALAWGCLAVIAAGAAASAAAQDRTPVAVEQPPPSDFTTNITNPLFPLSVAGPKLLVGQETDPDTSETYDKRLESELLDDTKVLDSVTTAIWEERAYEDGELVEVALDYYAQDSAGNVWYFGEHVDNYENGAVVNNDGQWFAGEGENKAGVLMPGNPQVGETYQQEDAPGIAEDKIDIVSVTDTVTTPAGTYNNCVKTRDYTPLEPGLEEFKWHCPGVGLARETGPGFEITLQSVGESPAAIPPSGTSASMPAEVSAPNTGSGPSDAVDIGLLLALAAVIGLGITTGVVVARSVRRKT